MHAIKDLLVSAKAFTKLFNYFSRTAKVIATPENVLTVPSKYFSRYLFLKINIYP